MRLMDGLSKWRIKLSAAGRAKLLLSVNTCDSKELWSSIGQLSDVVKSVFDLGPPFDDINAVNHAFLCDVATDPDYD